MAKKTSRIKARKDTLKRQKHAKKRQTFFITGLVGLIVLATAVYSLLNLSMG